MKKKILNYYIYIVECSDKTLYTGITNNLEKRIKTHNNGTGAKYTRARRPVKLVYSCMLPNKSQALKYEFKTKALNRINKYRLINGEINLYDLKWNLIKYY